MHTHAQPHTAPPIVHEVLRSAGRPLDQRVQAAAAARFGQDFSRVRVHTDSRSSASAAALGATAYTVGSHIAFRANQYRPDTPGGRRLLAHELTHVVQQSGQTTMPTGPLPVGPPDTPAEREAHASVAAGRARTGAPVTRQPNPVVQRAIGLEIEVSIPVDQLNGGDVATLGGYEAAVPPQRVQAGLYASQHGRVGHGTILRPLNNGFHVEADHDNRVRSSGLGAGPLREGGVDSIMEIVTDANGVDTVAQLNQVITNVRTWIGQVEAATNGMRTRALIPGGGGGEHVGPLTYGPPLLPARLPAHNWRGSMQVNLGIDLREYHSMMKWFANSSYSNPNRVPAAERQLYRDIRAHLLLAVNAGRTVVDDIIHGNLPGTIPLTAPQVQQAGNLRGIRGWMTHLASYLARANAAGLGGTNKNLAPMLLKTPPLVAAHYGMTANEVALFNARSTAILERLLTLVGRAVPPGTGPATPVFGAHPATAWDVTVAGAPWGAVAPTGADLINLAGGVTPLTGRPLIGATGVGPARAGAHVGGIPAPAPGALGGIHVPGGVAPAVVGAGARGGVVSEFRTLPGFYRPNQWADVAGAFLRAAIRRNARPGE